MQEQIDEFDRKQCSAFALLWNWLHCHLHSDVIANFDEWMDSSMLPCMTPQWQELSKIGSYTVDLPDRSFTFNNVKLAPPAGVMASNYARCAKFNFYSISYLLRDYRPMHTEIQPHDYAISFTSCRTADFEDGGHFYLGAYGIKIESAANTVIAWQPKDVHGTSLQFRHPTDNNPLFVQRGICLVTSSRLTRVWQKYAATLGVDTCAANVEAKKAENNIYYNSDSKADEIYE